MKRIIFLLLFSLSCFAGEKDVLTLTWGGGENDTTYNLSYSSNDTSIAFRVFPFTDASVAIKTLTFDADSANRISFYPIWSLTGEDNTTISLSSFKDSVCVGATSWGGRIQLRDSLTKTASVWTPPLALSIPCPVWYCRIVADGSVATDHMNGGTTASTGVVRVFRYQPLP